MGNRHTGMQLTGDFALDIKVERNSKGEIEGGLVLGDTTYQNQALLLVSQKGELKEYPLVGVGISDVVNDHDIRLWERRITEQFERDGMRIQELALSSDAIKLDALYVI